ncbi:hypothetical protein [Bacillus cereus]|uniref:hypothetical protein n=1 Tax=Bacillus cereus TaxID=1396 RepID=UPI0018F58804|nr:hypothetical protein [Bacillus cereus]MBJ7987306.1 hypothetical protein [Bacillus cereus]
MTGLLKTNIRFNLKRKLIFFKNKTYLLIGRQKRNGEMSFQGKVALITAGRQRAWAIVLVKQGENEPFYQMKEEMK